jgi:hypothetical protein
MFSVSTPRSPLDGLDISKPLVLEFFVVFSRFEFALKEVGYNTVDHYKNLLPDWKKFSSDAAPWFITIPEEYEQAIAYLLGNPPCRQIKRTGAPIEWLVQTYSAQTTNAVRILDAVKTVRNNLFHGGKHTPHSPPGRDEELIKASLTVLRYCLVCADALRIEYEGGY